MALIDYIVNKPVLRTERLTLRQLHPSDIPALKEWMSDKSMYTYWGKPAAVVFTVVIGTRPLANPYDIRLDEADADFDAAVKHIQIEVIQPGSKLLSGRVVTDKEGYKAGDIVSVSVSKTVSYDVGTLAAGDWIDVSYKTVREKKTHEFVAINIDNISGDYPTTFTIIENGKVIKSNTLLNPRIASELPSLILSGSPEISFCMDSVPDVPRYLIIDIGSSGDKIYYTFEKGGSYYVGHDNMYEISRGTFDELMQYIYKNEIQKWRCYPTTKHIYAIIPAPKNR